MIEILAPNAHVRSQPNKGQFAATKTLRHALSLSPVTFIKSRTVNSTSGVLSAISGSVCCMCRIRGTVHACLRQNGDFAAAKTANPAI
jgi:hypothetical protein